MARRIVVTAPTVAPALASARYRRRKCVSFLNYLRAFEKEFGEKFNPAAKHYFTALEELTKGQIESYDLSIEQIEEALK